MKNDARIPTFIIKKSVKQMVKRDFSPRSVSVSTDIDEALILKRLIPLDHYMYFKDIDMV